MSDVFVSFTRSKGTQARMIAETRRYAVYDKQAKAAKDA
jgi:hypothetical protein